MKGATHLSAGIITGMIFTAATQQSEGLSATMIATCGIMALFPDIDKPSSTIGRRVPFFSIPASIAGHRTIFHAPTPYIALYLFLLFHFPSCFYWATAGLLGILSHLFLDMLNPAGIPLLFPFTTKRYRIAGFRSGGFADWVVGITMLSRIAIKMGM